MRSLYSLSVYAILLAGLCAGCMAIPSASERATDAARELNLASRFGRMDVAVEHTSSAARKNFIGHRAEWGKDIRILDVELASMSMHDGSHAEIQVDYSWNRIDESVLRNTRVTQNWEDVGEGWKLTRERRLNGDLGLFGEPTQIAESEPRPDVQFPTKVIP